MSHFRLNTLSDHSRSYAQKTFIPRYMPTKRLRTTIHVVCDGVVEESALWLVWELDSGRWVVEDLGWASLAVDWVPWTALLDTDGCLRNFVSFSLVVSIIA